MSGPTMTNLSFGKNGYKDEQMEVVVVLKLFKHLPPVRNCAKVKPNVANINVLL
jgi:hypothetical protein